MATGEVDQKILAFIAREAVHHNPLLAQHLFQVLGLSVQLSAKLYRARKLRKLDISRGTRSLDLYHSILFLSREGLSLTEIYILPYCQDGECGAECRVMAARLRAAFYHNFCLFHNNPPVSQLRNERLHAAQSRDHPGDDGQTGSARGATLRDAIPSITSESSYVTNPFTPDLGPPSPAPKTPLPATPPRPRKAPKYPPGLNPAPAYQPPVSSATYLLPASDYTIPASRYFQTAMSLADRLLAASHPLRLAVTLEYSAFLFECMADIDASIGLCKRAILAAYREEGYVSDAVFTDTKSLLHELAQMAMRGEELLGINKIRTTTPPFPPPTRELPMLPPQAVSSPPASELQVRPILGQSQSSRQLEGLGITQSSELETGFNMTQSQQIGTKLGTTDANSATLVGSPATLFSVDEAKNSKGFGNGSGNGHNFEEAKRSHASSRSGKSSKTTKSSRTRTEGTGTDKERKRRAVERAEEELLSKRSNTSETGTIFRVT